MKVDFTRAKGKDNYKVNMMPIGDKLKNMERKTKKELPNVRMKQSKNITQRVKSEWQMVEEMNEGENLCDGFEKGNMPLGVWLASKISVVSRHLRTLNYSQDKT